MIAAATSAGTMAITITPGTITIMTTITMIMTIIIIIITIVIATIAGPIHANACAASATSTW